MRLNRRKFFVDIGVAAGTAALALGLGLLNVLAQKPPQSQDVVVFAAASLKNALDAASAEWQKETGKKVTVSYAASSALAKQIEQGAPATLFISADLDWMDYLAKKDLIVPDSRSNLLGNRLVLVVPKDQATTIDIKPGFDLAKTLGTSRLAMGEVSSVPAGKYGKAALEKLGVWSTVSEQIAQAENVRAALTLVSRGEAAAGIVYKTDAAADSGVAVAGVFPEDSHPPIIYPAALTKGATNPDSEAFLAYLRSAKAKPIFEAQGFNFLQ